MAHHHYVSPASDVARELGDVALKIGLIGLGVYLGYKVLEQSLGPVASAVTKPLANIIVWATSPQEVKPSGQVILPNGAKIPASAMQSTVISGGVFYFDYGGRKYKVLPNPSGGPAYDVQGDYHAELVQ